MPRQANKKESVRITITTTDKVRQYLESLVAIGLYGSTVSEAAAQLVCESLRNDLRRKRLATLDQVNIAPNKNH